MPSRGWHAVTRLQGVFLCVPRPGTHGLSLLVPGIRMSEQSQWHWSRTHILHVDTESYRQPSLRLPSLWCSSLAGAPSTICPYDTLGHWAMSQAQRFSGEAVMGSKGPRHPSLGVCRVSWSMDLSGLPAPRESPAYLKGQAVWVRSSLCCPW